MPAQWIHVPDGYAAMIFKVQEPIPATPITGKAERYAQAMDRAKARTLIDNGNSSAPH